MSLIIHFFSDEDIKADRKWCLTTFISPRDGDGSTWPK